MANVEAEQTLKPMRYRFSEARGSIATRVSRVFSREPTSTVTQSQRTSGACSVPIFMSPSSDRLPRNDDSDRYPRNHTDVTDTSYMRSPTYARHSGIPSSSVYSQSPGHPLGARFMEQISEESSDLYGSHQDDDLERGIRYQPSITSEVYLIRGRRRRRRRVKESTRQKIAGKKRLTWAFGITFLGTGVTYAALAATGTAHGLMFHIFIGLFLVILLAALLHSVIRLFMLTRRRKARRAEHQGWHGASRSQSTSSTQDHSEITNDLSEKSVEIKLGPEQVITTTPRGKNKKVVTQPPPIYGNFRESRPMNPELLYWEKREPSPTTPTYEEALKDAQTAVGFQPPNYASPQRIRLAPDGSRVSAIHPLERARVVGLMDNTMLFVSCNLII